MENLRGQVQKLEEERSQMDKVIKDSKCELEKAQSCISSLEAKVGWLLIVLAMMILPFVNLTVYASAEDFHKIVKMHSSQMREVGGGQSASCFLFQCSVSLFYRLLSNGVEEHTLLAQAHVWDSS